MHIHKKTSSKQLTPSLECNGAQRGAVRNYEGGGLPSPRSLVGLSTASEVKHEDLPFSEGEVK